MIFYIRFYIIYPSRIFALYSIILINETNFIEKKCDNLSHNVYIVRIMLIIIYIEKNSLS